MPIGNRTEILKCLENLFFEIRCQPLFRLIKLETFTFSQFLLADQNKIWFPLIAMNLGRSLVYITTLANAIMCWRELLLPCEWTFYRSPLTEYTAWPAGCSMLLLTVTHYWFTVIASSVADTGYISLYNKTELYTEDLIFMYSSKILNSDLTCRQRLLDQLAHLNCSELPPQFSWAS